MCVCAFFVARLPTFGVSMLLNPMIWLVNHVFHRDPLFTIFASFVDAVLVERATSLVAGCHTYGFSGTRRMVAVSGSLSQHLRHF